MSGVLSTGNFYKGDDFYKFRCICNDNETTLYSNSNNPPLCNGCPTVNVSPINRANNFRYRNIAGDEKKNKLAGGIFSLAVIAAVIAIGAHFLTKNMR